MENTRTLFDIYKNYKNGNKESFANLLSIKNNGNFTHLAIADKNLQNMIKKGFRDYKTASVFKKENKKHYKKDVPSIFMGTFEDMKDIYLLEFQKILTQNPNPVFDDKEQLYGALKRNVSAVINPEIKSYDTFSETFSLQNIYDYESGEMTEHDLTNDYAFQQWSYEQNEILKDWQDEIQIDEQKESENQKLNRQKIKNYNGLMLEIFLLICNEDLKNMLPSNSIIARNLIDIIFNYSCTLRVTSKGKLKHIRHKDMAKLFQKMYGYSPTEKQLSKAYNTVYNLIMNCLFGNVPISRTDFCGGAKDKKSNKKKSKQKNKDEQKNKTVKTIEHIATPEETAYYMKLLEKDRNYYKWNKKWGDYYAFNFPE